jgi:hypothetical protein
VSTTPLSLSYLALDAQNDPVFADGTSLTGVPAVAQAMLTRLKLWRGEWWENLLLGLPVMQSMVGQLGSPRTQSAIQQYVTDDLATLAPYVTAVSSVTPSFTGGKFGLAVNADTAFGPAAVDTAPGASAVLGNQ